jgi:hypothetical protein
MYNETQYFVMKLALTGVALAFVLVTALVH